MPTPPARPALAGAAYAATAHAMETHPGVTAWGVSADCLATLGLRDGASGMRLAALAFQERTPRAQGGCRMHHYIPALTG